MIREWNATFHPEYAHNYEELVQPLGDKSICPTVGFFLFFAGQIWNDYRRVNTR